MDFTVPADHCAKLKKKKTKRRISTWTLLGNWKKLKNMKVTLIPIVIGALGTVAKSLVKGLWNKRSSGDHPNYNIIEIGQYTEKSPGNLSRLLSLKLQWKTIS